MLYLWNKTLPYRLAEAVTPHDSNAQGSLATQTSDAVHVGGAGNLSIVINGANVVLAGIAAGTTLPISISRVRSTSNTATAIVALFY